MRIQSICLVLVAVTLLVSRAHLASAHVSQVNFIGAFYKGNDLFYGRTVVAYEAGANASVAVSAYNDYYSPATANITTVKIWFDWGTNYTSSEVSMDNRFTLERYQSHVFTIVLQLPTDVSNMVTHSYKAYVEYIAGMNDSEPIISTWTYEGNDFAVYSSDQADAQDLYMKLITLGVLMPSGYPYYYLPPIASFPYLPIVSSEARMLWTEARTDGTTGTLDYSRGDFAGAKSQFQTALDKIDQSFAAEGETGKDYEDSFSGLMGGIGNAFNRSGDSVLILAVGIGLGAALFGVGVLVYGLAKLRATKIQAPAK